MDTFLIQSNIKTKEMVAECTENRTTPKETLCRASHALREIVMELNVDVKRFPPALGETTWTGMVAECTENRTTPKETLCCASHTLREIVMELNVDIKRLPPALGETTWAGMVAECTENRTTPKETLNPLKLQGQ
jgi:hypothetical protein